MPRFAVTLTVRLDADNEDEAVGIVGGPFRTNESIVDYEVEDVENEDERFHGGDSGDDE